MPDRRSEKQRQPASRDDEVTEAAEERELARVESARETSAAARDLLEEIDQEIDQALKVALGYDPSEEVDDEERQKRERSFTIGFVQKGGE